MTETEKLLLDEIRSLKESLSDILAERNSFKPSREPVYVTIKQLAKHLGISTTSARNLARSKHLRRVKGAVVNTNTNGDAGKYEILKIRLDAAVKVFEANPQIYVWRR